MQIYQDLIVAVLHTEFSIQDSFQMIFVCPWKELCSWTELQQLSQFWVHFEMEKWGHHFVWNRLTLHEGGTVLCGGHVGHQHQEAKQTYNHHISVLWEEILQQSLQYNTVHYQVAHLVTLNQVEWALLHKQIHLSHQQPLLLVFVDFALRKYWEDH